MNLKLDYIYNYEPNPSSLIPLLQKTQENFGYLPREALEEISKYLNIPLSRVYGVATFYAQFRFEPLGKYVVRICHGTACHVNGAVNISQAIREEVGIEEGQTTEDGLITLERVACLGCCSLAPVIMINDKVFGKLTPEKVRKLMKKLKEGKLDV
ncbi:MAG: NADH-quinone oxidoreductase subunit NuoE [Palaeococcus sp.]|uniref:NADH-quinone oxidoreductase subunit NuoE n=1 Tax=Palaeococcus sp. (in: euryarchaeotes) TaxID=2820298 RepID=UPI0025E2067B|nr:NADH-quinone oxidoreductase subunit NuoE [Palaeococcus sp. (in: euryarchaeotes)]MCD6559765.1 NADH-quinone oxidoreductase subunit NuoE [Palaeococcus sp. (in: euryarchaeotes)]